MRTRNPTAGRLLTEAEQTELRLLLHAIPVGAERYDERIRPFVDAWCRIHVPPKVGRYAIYRLPFGARADLLDSLRTAMDDPDLRIAAKANCSCDRCDDLRGGR